MYGFTEKAIVQGQPIGTTATLQGMHGAKLVVSRYTPKQQTRWVTIKTTQGRFSCGIDDVLLTHKGWVRVRRIYVGDRLLAPPIPKQVWRASQNVMAAKLDPRELTRKPWLNLPLDVYPAHMIKCVEVGPRERLPIYRLHGPEDCVVAHGYVFRVGVEEP